VITRPHNSDHSKLTALADGTVSGRRRRRLEERVARDPALRAELDRQRFAVDALRSANLGAPASLRAGIVAERERGRRPAHPRRLGVGGAIAAVAAAGVLALLLALPGGAGSPTVVEASELAELPPTGAAPQSDGAGRLAVDAFGLPFPDWAPGFGWRAAGVRRDEIDGRDAVTVFYEKGGRRIAYTVVSGDRIDPPAGAASTMRAATRLSYLDDRGRPIVTWEREGLTCILSGEGVPRGVLLDLAAWQSGRKSGLYSRKTPPKRV
jgi:hypothetical protein